jgi:hypothetical protein
MSLSYPTQRRSQCRTSLHATVYGPCPDGQAAPPGLWSGRVIPFGKVLRRGRRLARLILPNSLTTHRGNATKPLRAEPITSRVHRAQARCGACAEHQGDGGHENHHPSSGHVPTPHDSRMSLPGGRIHGPTSGLATSPGLWWHLVRVLEPAARYSQARTTGLAVLTAMSRRWAPVWFVPFAGRRPLAVVIRDADAAEGCRVQRAVVWGDRGLPWAGPGPLVGLDTWPYR